jgi:hypothetical protein
MMHFPPNPFEKDIPKMPTTAAPRRMTPPPWMPGDSPGAMPSNTDRSGPSDLPSGTADDFPPEAIFEKGQNFGPEEISELMGIPLETILAAAEKHEISSVCSTNPRVQGGKVWPGPNVAAWVRRANIPLNPSRHARRQIESHLRGLHAQAAKTQVDQSRDQRIKAEREQFYREAATRCPALVDVLTVFDRMAQEKATPADILKLLAQ